VADLIDDHLYQQGAFGRCAVEGCNKRRSAHADQPHDPAIPVVSPLRKSSRRVSLLVKTGLKQAPRVQVLDGLKQGELVVSEGGFILKSEMMKGELGED